MITSSEYTQLKAFARQDGFLIGLLWIATLGCLVGSMTDPNWQIGFVAGFCLTPYLAYKRLQNYRDNVVERNISYRRGFVFLTMAMFYASLIIAAATFAYFYFLDKGLMLTTLQHNMSMPELREAFKQAGMPLSELDKEVQMMAQTRPIDIAFSILCNAIISSTILSAFIALFGRKREKVRG